MKIALYSQKYKAAYQPLLAAIFTELLAHKDQIVVEADLWRCYKGQLSEEVSVQTFRSVADLPPDTNLMLTIGGDGTILWAMTYIQHLQIPILGINAGRLGFLATISEGEIASMFANLRAGPTGSTGYSLSCGGPVIMPHSKTLVLTPIAPHNLNARPLVIPDNTEITLQIYNREGCYLATYDARSCILPCKTAVKISLAPFTLSTVVMEDNDFFKTLRHKLLWGEDKRN